MATFIKLVSGEYSFVATNLEKEYTTKLSFYTVKPLNTRHLWALKNVSVIKRCPRLGGSLTMIVTFGTKYFVHIPGMAAIWDIVIGRFHCSNKYLNCISCPMVRKLFFCSEFPIIKSEWPNEKMHCKILTYIMNNINSNIK